MSASLQCCSPCESLEVTNVPGVEGDPGTNGTNGTPGVSAYTTLNGDMPLITAIGQQETATVFNNSWAAIGQTIFISDQPANGTSHGTFEVISLAGTTGIVVEFLGAPGDSAVNFTISSGAQVTPAGATGALAGALPNPLVDASTGTASDAIAATVSCFTLSIPHTFEAGVGAGEVVTEYILGYAFKILAWSFIADVPSTGAGASRVFNMEIGATDVGTVVSTCTVTLASTSAKGEQTLGTAVSGANVGTALNNFSIEVAAGGTTFTAGSGTFLVLIQNMDSANSIASLADHINDIISAL